MILERRLWEKLEDLLLYREVGQVTHSLGLLYEADLPGAALGSLCAIFPGSFSGPFVEAEVVGFRERKVLLMPFEEARGLHHQSRVVLKKRTSHVKVGPFLLGRVIDGMGQAMDGGHPLQPDVFSEERSLIHQSPAPFQRPLIERPIDLGIRAINGLLTCGYGQRLAIMAGSGVGKSVLLGMMARHAAADLNVIALIGERGREVKEFIEKDLGPEGLKKSIVVVSTSDKSPLVRMRAAFLATTIAEYFRDQGRQVLLLMDSVTRFCMAQREISLSMGEPPASKGYTPSVFAAIPKLLERTGMGGNEGGSITGLYSVLVEGEDFEDPIADAVRATLDGHLVLSRALSQKNHFPAIDVLKSTSRVMRAVTTPTHYQQAAQLKDWMATYDQIQDLLYVGAYTKGSHAQVDTAIAAHERWLPFLKQRQEETTSLDETLHWMSGIVSAV